MPPVEARLQRASEACARRGARLTPTRRVVLEMILDADEPVGAYTLLDRLRERRGTPAAPPTVYRALDFLLDQGLIHKVERLGAFVGCVEESDHPHPAQFLICGRCGAAAEMEDHAVAEALAQAAARQGFQATRATIEVEGVCAACVAAARD